ncbi:hypothetical protein Nepgr_013181 [Nepenthes gracilis]|uniref:Uncharacterized protein n=1 Tax=Nepenthes gracilis TaxID=150966 RepID=A0AAD3XP49_NEPGR|nr:hypothetical protein Nepgr_013181 [Nepenthes gracilis]
MVPKWVRTMDSAISPAGAPPVTGVKSQKSFNRQLIGRNFLFQLKHHNRSHEHSRSTSSKRESRASRKAGFSGEELAEDAAMPQASEVQCQTSHQCQQPEQRKRSGRSALMHGRSRVAWATSQMKLKRSPEDLGVLLYFPSHPLHKFCLIIITKV